MSKKTRVTPEIVQTVKEIYDNHPGWCHWEVGRRVGVCDETVRRILNNEYHIEGDIAVRIYKKPKKTNNCVFLPIKEAIKVNFAKQFLNTLYGSKGFQVSMKDICEEVGQIREALTDLSNSLK